MIRLYAFSIIFFFSINVLLSQPPCASKNDFTFERNICNPLLLTFFTNSNGFNSIKWDLGDGNIITNSTNPTSVYNNTGNYFVRMIQNYGSCVDTVVKLISLDYQNDNNLIQSKDTSVCNASTVQLSASSSTNSCWAPSTYLNNQAITNPIATPL